MYMAGDWCVPVQGKRRRMLGIVGGLSEQGRLVSKWCFGVALETLLVVGDIDLGRPAVAGRLADLAAGVQSEGLRL